GVQTCALPISSFIPPKSVNDSGLTGGATFKGIASVGCSFVMLVNTLSTAGRQVRPPQNPIPALVLNFNSRAEQLYCLAASSKSLKLTSSQRQMITSFICILLRLTINRILILF